VIKDGEHPVTLIRSLFIALLFVPHFPLLIGYHYFKPPHIAMNCKPKARRKTAWLNFRATSAEALLLTQAAEMAGVQCSTLLRRAALQAATEALAACQ
jgi:hypothetical protein